MAAMAAKVCRKPGNGVRRLREADRFLKRPASKYLYRRKTVAMCLTWAS